MWCTASLPSTWQLYLQVIKIWFLNPPFFALFFFFFFASCCFSESSWSLSWLICTNQDNGVSGNKNCRQIFVLWKTTQVLWDEVSVWGTHLAAELLRIIYISQSCAENAKFALAFYDLLSLAPLKSIIKLPRLPPPRKHLWLPWNYRSCSAQGSSGFST